MVSGTLREHSTAFEVRVASKTPAPGAASKRVSPAGKSLAKFPTGCTLNAGPQRDIIRRPAKDPAQGSARLDLVAWSVCVCRELFQLLLYPVAGGQAGTHAIGAK